MLRLWLIPATVAAFVLAAPAASASTVGAGGAFLRLTAEPGEINAVGVSSTRTGSSTVV